MEHAKSKDQSAHARDLKLPYFDDNKDKMDSYLFRLRSTQQLTIGMRFYERHI